MRANMAYAKLASMTMQSIIGQPYYRVFPNIERPIKECVGALQSSIYDECESEIILPDGSTYVTRAFVMRNRRGVYRHAIHIMHDVTWEREKEKQVRDAALRLDSIMRAAPIGVGLVEHRVIRYINENACIITGYNEDELIGQSTRMLYADAAEFERAGKVLYDSIGEGGCAEIESRLRRKDDRIIDVMIRASAIERHDLSAGVSFTVTDISERKAQENRLQKQLDELKRFQCVAIGRESRIKELRGKVKRLELQLSADEGSDVQ